MIDDKLIASVIAAIDALDGAERIDAINAVRAAVHEVSPFKSEPVDFVRWVPNGAVYANDYNPNSVAPPEMELLRVSICADGYTQPIVSMPDDKGAFEVVDGFHRHRVGKEISEVCQRVHGYLPLVSIRASQYDKSSRIASTIRHNRARGNGRLRGAEWQNACCETIIGARAWDRHNLKAPHGCGLRK